MKKVFIIGLDGGPYREVKEWIDAGELPFLYFSVRTTIKTNNKNFFHK
jgi:hypothetical protein